MPNIKSAKKRVLISAKKEVNNSRQKSTTRTAIKNFNKELEAGNKKKAEEKLNVAIKNIDKATKSSLIHKKKAARLKSQLTKNLNQMETK